MNIVWASSLFFLIAWLALFSSLFVYKKSDDKLEGAMWIPLLIVVIICIHTLIAAVLTIIHIPVNIVSIGIIECAIAGLLWRKIYKSKEYQKYKFEISDVLMLLGILVLIVFLVEERFDGKELLPSFFTIDPAVHFQNAMNTIIEQSVANMYLASLRNALFIETFGCFTTVDKYYKLFVISELVNFGLSGCMFYGVTKLMSNDRFTRLAGVIISLIYVVGYPLNSTLYGFVYLGMGVTIVSAIVCMADYFNLDRISRGFNIAMLMLLCVGVFQCYMLFMPVTFFAVIVSVFFKQKRDGKLISLDTVKVCLAIFLIPCIVGLGFAFAGTFSGGESVASAISQEGACYRLLYTNFVPFLPLAIYGLFRMITKKTNEVMIYLSIFTFGFVAVLFYKAYKLEVSTYYYYKNYFLAWFVLFFLAMKGIVEVEKKSRTLIVCFFGVWALVFSMMLTGTESKIAQKNPMLNEYQLARTYNDIYGYNFENIKIWPKYTTEKMDLYSYVYNELLSQDEIDKVPIASYWEDVYWYQDVTNTRDASWNSESGEYEYVLVLNDFKSTVYNENVEYFESLEKLYGNGAGFVARVSK